MRALSSLRGSLERDVTPGGDGDGEAAARRGNRRRLLVFSVVFLLVLLPGLVWDYLRPAEYRASARVEISAGSVATRAPAAADPSSAPAASDLLTQAQVLTSRPLLEKVGAALESVGQPLPAGLDPADQLKAMIRIVAVDRTDVIELQATGSQPELLAAALNLLVDTYREQLKIVHQAAAGEALAQAREEPERLGEAVRERRQRLDAFRAKYGVVSPERNENEAVAHLRGLTSALDDAVERAALTEARLRALQDTLAAGRSSVTAKDDPTLAGMEDRAAQMREALRDTERTYTQNFMEIDPRSRAMRARLAELEQQIETQRAASQQGALATARENAAAARTTVERLQAQVNAQRAQLQTFSQRFAQAKSLEEDLERIEKARRDALERLAVLESNERSRLPAVKLVEAAGVPELPFRPAYLRDAALVFAAAFGLGLLAMGFVELFNRQPSRPAAASMTTVVVPPQWALPSQAGQIAMPSAPALLPAGDAPPAGLLAEPAPRLRELTQDEVQALLGALAGETRFLAALLLMGLRADEVIALRQQDYDAAAATLRVPGGAPRTLSLPGWMADCRPPEDAPEAPLFQAAANAPISAGDIQAVLVCGAYDAEIADAGELDAAALRHTCIAWLVRQGVRFSDLAALVGRPSAQELAAYADLAPAGARLPGSEVGLLMPALRDFVAPA